MKARRIGLAALALGLAGSLSVGAFKTAAAVDISVGVEVNAVAEFHAPLAPHGVWVDVGSYGRCWRPSHVAVGWRPYCDGHWEWTDCGWYWVSDEPWAWATYHYGSWVHHHGGWVWVPGVEWAPAWVSWRVGGGHIGWAPLAPRGVIVAPSLFVFVDGPRFHERIRPNTVIVNNTTIINKTTQITEVKRETRNIAGRSQQVVVNEGPGAEAVQKITGKKLAAVPVTEVDRKTPVPAAVKRRAPEAATREAAPTTQEKATQDKKSAPDRKADQPDKKGPGEKQDKVLPPDKAVRPDRTPTPDKSDRPDRTPPTEKSDRPDRTPPAQRPDKPDKTPDKPDRAAPPEKSDRPPVQRPNQPDRASPPDAENPDRVAPPPSRPPSKDQTGPAPERRRPESPPQKSPGPSPGRERGKGKEKGPGA